MGFFLGGDPLATSTEKALLDSTNPSKTTAVFRWVKYENLPSCFLLVFYKGSVAVKEHLKPRNNDLLDKTRFQEMPESVGGDSGSKF